MSEYLERDGTLRGGDVLARAEYDPEDGPGISQTVIETLDGLPGFAADRGNVLLYDYVDPEALDRLVDSVQDGEAVGAVVSFALDSYLVSVHADGEVVVRERDAD